ncbi:HTTM domain-containing protein [Micromonospora avicenniae]|uniref:HTTM domain-containing protein n=1 Tax=Micromonospora avicenniae TaxID=1198245 RepID=UPI001FE3A322|nr:HTTM domain-containing protein [Micromonospora avicenniae]
MIRWLTEPVPRGRVAAFRTLIYLFVAADLVFFTPWVRTRVNVPGDLYQPLLVGRLAHLPTPTPALVAVIFWTLLGLALLAASGRAPRLLGWSVFALYLEWMIIAMSYGKVDHDRFGLLVALAVLPTVGRARHGDPTRCEAAGWALRVTQIAVVCTYFLAAWAKLRFGGLDWLTGSVLARAIIRRGTDLADLIAQVPYLLIVAQFGIIAFELASPLVFLVPARWRLWTVGFFYSFHLVTFATITISFAPHLAAMAGFLPLERVRPIHWLRRLRRRGSPAALGELGEHPLAAADDDLRPAPLGQPEQGVLGPVPPAPLGLGGGLPEPPHARVVLDAEPGSQADPVTADQPPRLRGDLGVEPEPGVA